MTPEPEDKLDAAAAIAAAVSGPEDVSGWHAVNWRACESNVRRLRQRIFTASMAGDLARVRRLQRLMLCSRSNALVSVRRVTERNAGRLTAGVDGEIVLTAEAKLALADRVQHCVKPFKAWPVRRVFIPKAGGKQRPLGIPVILDRAHQARVVNALEPEWEARFEPRSYGFRPGRGCHDAITAIYQTVKGPNPRRTWVLDADLAGAFDRIAHDHILNQLGSFPARGMVWQWLRAGVVENGRHTATEEGTPQGGVISPVLLNVALHGMEQAAGVRYARCGNDAARSAAGSPTLIRYADDFVALCHSRQDALEIKARLAAWLAPRGLAFNEDKTRVVTLREGFDFLGFNVRRYHHKPLIKPSKAAVRRIRERLRTELRSLRGHNARAVIRRLNPVIRGWAAYYRTQVSSQTFEALDQYLWQLTYKWALISHRNQSRPWVFARYFGKFNRSRQDRWVFGDRASGAFMHRFAWTGIVRHQIVPGTASVDDPALTDYWTKRRRKAPLPINSTSLRLYQAQNGCCPICKTALLRVDQLPPTPKDWERWLAAARDTITIATAGSATTPNETDDRLIHANCRHGTRPGALPAPEPTRPA
ncbi:MAG: group II intron reverse transcriptase/maturase [Solirubrobacteraceae bacterium]